MLHFFTNILPFSEMGTDRTPDPTAGPLPGHFSLLPRVKGQDGALQHKRSQTGENECLEVTDNSCGLNHGIFGDERCFQESEAARLLISTE